MVRLVFDNPGVPNAIENGGVSDFSSLDPILLSSFTPFTREKVECKDKKATRFFIIQPLHFHKCFGYRTRGFIDFISVEALTKLKDPEDGLKLLIFFPWEGYDLRHFEYVTIKYINSLVNVYNIPKEKILFCYGNILIKKYLDNCPLELNIPKSNIIGINIFSFIAYQDSNKLNFYIPDNINVNRGKKFLFKNGIARSHRMYLLGAFKSRGLLENMHFSWLNHAKYDYQIHHGDELKGIFTVLNTDKTQNKEYKASFLEVVRDEPHILDISQEEAALRENQIFNNDYLYNDSYASLVTETVVDEFDNNVLFFSEKTYQPIYNFHPFINVSGQGVLEHLRENDFQTFPELFDESYDSIERASDRIQKIINVVEEFCNIPNYVLDDIYSSDTFRDKLIHNWKTFRSISCQNEINKLVNWLISYN